MEDRHTGQNKGYGFLMFTTVELAEECIKLMDGVELDGRFVNVKWCISKAYPDAADVAAPRSGQPLQPRGGGHREPYHRERARQRESEASYTVRVLGLPSGVDWTCARPAPSRIAMNGSWPLAHAPAAAYMHASTRVYRRCVVSLRAGS